MENAENKNQMLQGLTDLKKQLMERRERLLRPVAEVEKQIAAVTETISLVLARTQPFAGPVDDSPRAALIRKLRKMTQPMAIVEIANYNDGILLAQEAKALMIHAGIMRPTKNVSSTIHSVIKRTGKFENVGRGKYRLKAITPCNLNSQITLTESGQTSLIGEAPMAHIGIVKQ